MKRVPLRKNTGFTLIELMIVIAIIAILAAILVPNMVRARSRSQLTACTTNLRNIATALEMYNVDFSGRYPTDFGILTPNYIKVVPECPAAASDTYTSSYTVTMIPDSFEIFCDGSNHAGFTSPGFPKFDSAQGLVERP
ncbi:MAG: prepilin-type N-terminal cleavage/methylation domain-containing protein [Vulcanimicrobiota bacterium]